MGGTILKLILKFLLPLIFFKALEFILEETVVYAVWYALHAN